MDTCWFCEIRPQEAGSSLKVKMLGKKNKQYSEKRIRSRLFHL